MSNLDRFCPMSKAMRRPAAHAFDRHAFRAVDSVARRRALKRSRSLARLDARREAREAIAIAIEGPGDEGQAIAIADPSPSKKECDGARAARI